MVDLPFYRDALIRNFIRYLIEEKPSEITLTEQMRENLCSVDEVYLRQLIEETAEFITSVKVDEKEKEDIVRRVKEICLG